MFFFYLVCICLWLFFCVIFLSNFVHTLGIVDISCVFDSSSISLSCLLVYLFLIFFSLVFYIHFILLPFEAQCHLPVIFLLLFCLLCFLLLLYFFLFLFFLS